MRQTKERFSEWARRMNFPVDFATSCPSCGGRDIRHLFILSMENDIRLECGNCGKRWTAVRGYAGDSPSLRMKDPFE